jgi:hypothetical protein
MARFLLLVMAVAICAGVLLFTAPSAVAQEYPRVADLKAFSAEANFMSLPGYLRWQVFLDRGEWLSPEECMRVVKEQQGGMGM